MNTEEFLEHQKAMLIDAINETTNKNTTEGLRDYFAGLAIQGLIAATHQDNDFQRKSAARLAYLYADAMLRERERGK